MHKNCILALPVNRCSQCDVPAFLATWLMVIKKKIRFHCNLFRLLKFIFEKIQLPLNFFWCCTVTNKRQKNVLKSNSYIQAACPTSFEVD